MNQYESDMLNEKAEQLAELLEIPMSDIEIRYDEGMERAAEFRTPDGTYTVMTEEEAKAALQEDIESFIEEYKGISGFTEAFQEEIKMNYIDNSELEEFVREDCWNYAEGIKTESGDKAETRLLDECVEAGIISYLDLNGDGMYEGDIDLVEAFSEYHFNEIEKEYDGNLADYIASEFDEETLNSFIEKNPNLLDTEAIAEAVERQDGYGNSLASWDGMTEETQDFYVFKQSDTDDRENIIQHEQQEMTD